MQSQNGGFVWFKGGPDDRYITQYIVTGIGHLKKLNALPKNNGANYAYDSKRIPYLDKEIKEDYDELVKQNKTRPCINIHQVITKFNILYMRSFFPEHEDSSVHLKLHIIIIAKQCATNMDKQSKYMQGMIALALFRTGDGKTLQTSLQDHLKKTHCIMKNWECIGKKATRVVITGTRRLSKHRHY